MSVLDFHSAPLRGPREGPFVGHSALGREGALVTPSAQKRPSASIEKYFCRYLQNAAKDGGLISVLVDGDPSPERS